MSENSTDKKEGQADEPRYMTTEEMNAAMSNHTKRLREQFRRDLQESLAGIVQQGAKPAEEGVKVPEGASELEKQLVEMKNRFESSERMRKEEEQRRLQQEHERMESEEVLALEKSLRSGGIQDEDYLESARALLYREQKKIVRDESGRIKFKVSRDGYDDLLELDAGVKEWLGGERGRKFLPPTGATGSSAKPAAASRGKVDPRAEAEAVLRKAFGLG